ncbi:MAG: hypothetical protein HYZ93_03280 [Candidatus Omnitrophica bacterium]|nr:hypothetical protein [Candidatus Omnitrophota bacterium]
MSLQPIAAFAVEVEPPRLELTIPADQPTGGSLEVANRSGKRVSVQVKTGGYRFLQPGLELPSAQGWFSFEPSSLILGPQSSTRVNYSITPPPNVAQDAAGEYLAAILIDERPAGESAAASGSKVTIVPRFAMPVYLKIKGRELIQVEIGDLSLEGDSSSLKVRTTLTNQGTVHIRPAGALTILEQSGKTVQTELLGKGLPLLPTARLEIPAAVPLPPPGRYRAVVTLETGPGKLLQKEKAFEVTADRQVAVKEI